MDISSIYGSTAATPAATGTRSTNNELDKDAFLKILVTQLSNQDPLSPMEDKDFIAQLAQFSSLEELQTLNTGSTFSQASSLVGKNIYTTVTNADGVKTEVYGKVTSAMTNGGKPFIEVNGSYVPYDEKIVVYDYSNKTIL